MKRIQEFGYEKVIGKTTSGGKYAEIYYFCDYNRLCAKEDATHCIIYEKAKNGSVLHTIHCKL